MTFIKIGYGEGEEIGWEAAVSEKYFPQIKKEKRGGKEGGGRRLIIRGERRRGERDREEQEGVGSKQEGGATGVGEKESRR